MSARPAAADPVVLDVPAADLCLAFANTRYWRGSSAPTEDLAAPADLLGWCGAHGVPAEAIAAAGRKWQQSPRDGQRQHRAAIELREAIYGCFAAIAAEAAPAAADLAALNAALAAAPARRALTALPEGYGWQVPGLAATAVGLLAPVLWSAGDLLTLGRRGRIRCCANEKCRWLFVDDSRAGTRRWCSMSACGNRAKARRHYERHKQT